MRPSALNLDQTPRDAVQIRADNLLSAVLRVSDIFENPEFFKDGASSSDIEQGRLGDCWFLSALSTVATVPGLLDRICVEVWD